MMNALFALLMVLQTTNPAYLREMPSADRVKAEIRGTDAMDTAARQAGAFFQLREMIYTMALNQRRGRDEVTPDEKRLADGYYAAAYYAAEPIEKNLSSEEKPRWTRLRGRYSVDPDFRNEILQRFFSPGFRAAYAQANEQLDQRVAALQERDQQAFREAQQAEQNARQQQAMQGQDERRIARCVAAGRPELQCVTEGLDKGLTELLGIANPSLKKTPPRGIRLNGIWAAESGFTLGFASGFTMASCDDVMRDDLYAVDLKNGQLLVTVQNDTPYILRLTPDGKLTAPGSVKITGRKVVGERVYTDGRREPVYGMRTATCALGSLSQAGKTPIPNVSEALGGLGGSNKRIEAPLGLRMAGLYAGQGGFAMEFLPDTVIMDCGPVPVARPYTVSQQAGQVIISIQHDSGPINLTYQPDGKLAGSGQVQLNGRVVVGVTGNSANPVAYQAKSASCSIGLLTPTDEPMSEAEAGAAAAKAAMNANTSPSAAPAPKPVGGTGSAAVAPTGVATLSLTSGFPTQPGIPDPLRGIWVSLLKESAETAMMRVGVTPPAGMTAVRAWFQACSTGQATCMQVLERIMPSAAAQTTADSSGRVQFQSVPPGTYHLFGFTKANNQPVMWNLKVELKPGANAVRLDQTNIEK